jgi:hypothetical protein
MHDRVIQGKTMLILRDPIDLKTFEALLLDPSLHAPVRRIRHLNSVLNGEESPIWLQYWGLSSRAIPIILIQGKVFAEFLC